MKSPPAELTHRLLAVGETVLYGNPPPRLEDVARLVGASRATLYYYFSGRDDLVAFLLTAHARQGAEAVAAAIDADDPSGVRLRAMVGALADYLGARPGVCAGLVGALGTTGMSEALQANDLWIARPLRDLLTEAVEAGAAEIDDVAVAGDAVLGALLFAVLGRSAAGVDPTDPEFRRQITEQVVRGVLVSVGGRR